LGQAGWLSPSEAASQVAGEEAGFTGSSGGVRALPATRKRNRAARHDEKPFRAGSSNTGWFRARVNRSHSGECTVATVCQHGAERSGGCCTQQSAKPKSPKGGQRESPGPGRIRVAARFDETSKAPAMRETTHRWLVSQRQPERSEVRPVARGQRIAKSGGRPRAGGRDAETELRTCCDRFVNEARAVDLKTAAASSTRA
jgi:hypothetical protein